MARRPERLRTDVRGFIDLNLGEAVGFAADLLDREAELRRIPRQAARPPGFVVQTLILSKERFGTRGEAERWVKGHGFKTSHMGKGPDETANTWRFRQRNPGDFQAGSFRTFRLADGVQAVGGRPKK